MEDFLATIKTLDPVLRIQQCCEGAQLHEARADELKAEQVELQARIIEEEMLAHKLLRQAVSYRAEVVGTCRHLCGSPLNPSAPKCALPSDHGEEESHTNASGGLGWGNPPEKIKRWCWRRFQNRWFTRVEATREDGARYWRYRAEQEHFHVL